TSVFSRDGRLLACGGNVVQIWDVGTTQEMAILRAENERTQSVAFSRDGKTLVSGGKYSIIFWDVKTKKQLKRLKNAHKAEVYALAFSPDGTRFASASWDNTVKIWDFRNKKPMYPLKGHKERVCGLAFSPDGKWLASSCAGEVRIWNPYRNPE